MKTEEIELSEEMEKAISKAIEDVVGSEERRRTKEKEEKADVKKEGEEKEIFPEALKILLDIPLELSVEVGRTKVLLGDLLQITQGATLELDKYENEPVEILVNGRHIARGEVIIMGDKFGVRIIDIISPEERIKKLGKI